MLSNLTINASRGSVSAELALTTRERLAGLIGRESLREGEGLLIPACRMVHTFGMRFAVDAVFIGPGGEVVGVDAGLAPRRLSRFHPRAHAVLELPAGGAQSLGIAAGERLRLTEDGRILSPVEMRGDAALIPVAIFLLTVLTRLPFVSRLLYNFDSVQFALGLDDFDVALHQPQPPGYYLYVLMGRAMRLVTGEANSALVALSVIFSGLAVAAIYMLAREMYDRRTGLTAAGFAATSPLFWLHGEVALSYMPEAFMSVCISLVCFRMRGGRDGLWPVAAVLLAVAGGIRQNTAVFLFPLWLYSMRGLGIRRISGSFAVFGLAVSWWAFPMIEETGGLARYLSALDAHWFNAVAWRGITPRWVAFNAGYMSAFLAAGLAAAAAPLVYAATLVLRGRLKPGPGHAVFFVLWLAPAVAFHLLVYTSPAVPGHSLLWHVGLFIIAARALVSAARTAGAASRFAEAGALLACGVNAAVFLFLPQTFSAPALRAHDRVLAACIKEINRFQPEKTVIIGTELFTYSYRHIGYYAPRFIVYDAPPVNARQGRWHMTLRGGKTYLLPEIRIPSDTSEVVYFKAVRDWFGTGLPEGARLMDVGDGLSFAVIRPEAVGEIKELSRLKPVINYDKPPRP